MRKIIIIVAGIFIITEIGKFYFDYKNKDKKKIVLIAQFICYIVATVAAGIVVNLIYDHFFRNNLEESLNVGDVPYVSEERNLSYGICELHFCEVDISLRDKSDEVETIYHMIDNAEILKLYLREHETGIEYHDYEYKDGIVKFGQIPQGINLEYYALLQGYEERSGTGLSLSANVLRDNVAIANIITKKLDKKLTLANTFCVLDQNGQFIENAELYVQWDEQDIWRGSYRTNEKGYFPYIINLNEDRIIKVQILNPLGNGGIYECEVPLHCINMGEAVDDYMIFVCEDGSCYTKLESEYYQW